MSFTEGQLVGHYTIQKRLGSGGMAVVYQALDTKLERTVALKVMHQGFQDDPDLLARFKREAKVIARLDHPNIVPIYDFDEHDGQPYLVMKLINGQSLKWHMRKRVLELNEIATICTKIASALTYAHTEGVLHRDVKPGNVMLTEDGIPYLTDFGLARIAAQGESSLSAGMIVGTPHYISPEQASGEIEIGPAADVYALGIMLYEMVVGRVPFAAESTHAVIHDQIYTPPPLPSEINPEIPTEVELVLLKALEKNPADRHTTPDDMLAAFDSALQTSGLRELSPDRSEIAAQSMAQRKKHTSPTPQRIQRPTADKNNTISEFELDFGKMQHMMGKMFRGEITVDNPDAPYIPPDEDAFENEIQQRVRRRIRAQRKFWVHAVFFLIINIALFLTSAMIADVAEAAIIADLSPQAALWLQQPDAGFNDLRTLHSTQPTLALEIAEARIAVEAATAPWFILITFLSAAGLAAHRVFVNSLSAKTEDKRDRLLMRKLTAQHGIHWEHRITQGQYAAMVERTRKRFCWITGFWQHVVVFFWVSVGLSIINAQIRDIMLPTVDMLRVTGDLSGAQALQTLSETPFLAIIPMVWFIGLIIHLFVLMAGRGNALERELERERSMTRNRRTPTPAIRIDDDDADNILGNALTDQPPVNIGTDGELTNSTVEAWQQQKRRAD